MVNTSRKDEMDVRGGARRQDARATAATSVRGAGAARPVLGRGTRVAFARTSRGEGAGPRGKADWRWAPRTKRQIKERLVLAGHDGAAGTLNRLATAAAAAGAPGPVFMAAGARALAVLVPAGVGRRLMEHARFPDTEAAIADYIAADSRAPIGHQFYTARHQVTVRVVHQIASGPPASDLPGGGRSSGRRRRPAASRMSCTSGASAPWLTTGACRRSGTRTTSSAARTCRPNFARRCLGRAWRRPCATRTRIAFLDNIGTSVGAADGAAPAALAEIQRRVAALRAGHTLLVATTGMDRLTRDPALRPEPPPPGDRVHRRLIAAVHVHVHVLSLVNELQDLWAGLPLPDSADADPAVVDAPGGAPVRRGAPGIRPERGGEGAGGGGGVVAGGGAGRRIRLKGAVIMYPAWLGAPPTAILSLDSADGMDIDAPAWPPADVAAADEGVIRKGDPGDFYMKVIAKKFRGVVEAMAAAKEHPPVDADGDARLRGAKARRPGQRGAKARRPGQRGANASGMGGAAVATE
eukprot:jgi/Tetstr1/460377/TSEL_005676.t1